MLRHEIKKGSLSSGDSELRYEEMSSSGSSMGDDDIFDGFDVRDGRLVINEVTVDNEECLMVRTYFSSFYWNKYMKFLSSKGMFLKDL